METLSVRRDNGERTALLTIREVIHGLTERQVAKLRDCCVSWLGLRDDTLMRPGTEPAAEQEVSDG